MKPLSKKALFFLAIVLILCSVCIALLQRGNREISRLPIVSLPVTPTPTSSNAVLSMDSPDGTKTLTLESQKLADLISYTLSVHTKTDGMQQLIFNSDTFFSQKFIIPFNTWSPDNSYVFLKEIRPNAVNYYVFQSTGLEFWDGSSLLSVQDLFSEQMPSYVIEDVTGWAAPNLLVVNAVALDSGQKVSFWFDVPSQSFIQLGTYFK